MVGRDGVRVRAGRVAFIAGAAAAVGSSVVKVPIAVCIRSVQANVYPNVAVAARSIIDKAGTRGLFTSFVPTLLEDAPDMAVKMAVYESLRAVHRSLHDGESVSLGVVQHARLLWILSPQAVPTQPTLSIASMSSLQAGSDVARPAM